jgi:hypothetical protein
VWAELKAPGPSIEINTDRGSSAAICASWWPSLCAPIRCRKTRKRTLARTALRTQRSAASSKPGLETSFETRAHLNESLVRIDDTLKGHMQRSAF